MPKRPVQRRRRVPRAGRRMRRSRQPGADPRALSENPWRRYVYDERITLAIGDNLDYLNSDVLGNYKKLVGIPATSNPEMDFAMLQITVWELSGEPVSLVLNDPTGLQVSGGTNESQAIVASKHDYPGRNRWAHVSLKYPARVRQFSMATGGPTPINKFVFTVRPVNELKGIDILLRITFRARRAIHTDDPTLLQSFNHLTISEAREKMKARYRLQQILEETIESDIDELNSNV